MIDVLRDVALASKQPLVWLTFIYCAGIIIKQMITNSRIRNELAELRMQKATADAALDYAISFPAHSGLAWEFLWCFRFEPTYQAETRFPTWPAYQHRYVQQKMRGYA